MGGLIESLSTKLGVPEARLTKTQTEMRSTRLAAMAGGSLGIALGCVIGYVPTHPPTHPPTHLPPHSLINPPTHPPTHPFSMLPLMFISGKKGNREESPREIYTSLAKGAQALLGVEEVVVYAVVERGGAYQVKEQYASFDVKEEGKGKKKGGGGREGEGGENALLFSPSSTLWQELLLPVLHHGQAVNYTAAPSSSASSSSASSSSASSSPSSLSHPHNALSWPVLDREGKLVAVAIALNHRTGGREKKEKEVGGLYTSFGPVEERMMVNLCVQLSEALDNLYRRPEEHNSFEQNADALAVHGGVGLRHVYA